MFPMNWLCLCRAMSGRKKPTQKRRGITKLIILWSEMRE